MPALTESMRASLRPQIPERARKNIGNRVSPEDSDDTEQALADDCERHVQHQDTRYANDDAWHRVAQPIERGIDDHDDAVGAVADWRDPHEQAGNVGDGRVIAKQRGYDTRQQRKAGRNCQSAHDTEARADTQ